MSTTSKVTHISAVPNMACSKVTKQIKTKFYTGFSWVTEGINLVQMVVLTFTKLAIMSIYGKLLKNHILSNQ